MDRLALADWENYFRENRQKKGKSDCAQLIEIRVMTRDGVTNVASLARGAHRPADAVDDVLDGAAAVELARERLHEARAVSRDDAVPHLVRVRVSVRAVARVTGLGLGSGLGLGLGLGLAGVIGVRTETAAKKYEYTPTPTAVCRAALTLYPACGHVGGAASYGSSLW